MKKSSTVATGSNKNFGQKLTIGLDLGDRSRELSSRNHVLE
jgi:hypothetical protein